MWISSGPGVDAIPDMPDMPDMPGCVTMPDRRAVQLNGRTWCAAIEWVPNAPRRMDAMPDMPGCVTIPNRKAVQLNGRTWCAAIVWVPCRICPDVDAMPDRGAMQNLDTIKTYISPVINAYACCTLYEHIAGRFFRWWF